MKSDQRNYVVVGVFVIAMIAGLILWIALLSGGAGATDDYRVRFDSVLGLTAGGTRVYFNGFQIGKIEAIERAESDADKMFVLDISVKQGWQIPDDSVTEITAAGLLSTNVLNIRRGDSTTLLTPGDEIRTREAANLMAELSETAANFGEFMNDTLKPQLETIVSSLTGTMENVSALLSKENTTRVGEILRNLERVSEEIDGLTDGLGATREQLDSAIGKVQKVLDQVGTVLGDVDKLIVENEANVSASVTDLHEALEALARHTEAIASNLEMTTRNMNEFSQQIREDPAVILRGREAAKEPGGSK